MRTNIVLDDELVSEATRLTGIAVRRELVQEALKTLIEVRKRKSLRDLKGKIHFVRGYDVRPLREARP